MASFVYVATVTCDDQSECDALTTRLDAAVNDPDSIPTSYTVQGLVVTVTYAEVVAAIEQM